jgi:HAD superfamily hydrolase (TIGR01509 family)
VFDPPRSDDRYRWARIRDFATVLESAGFPVTLAALDGAYAESERYLGGVWSTHRDVPVEDHVRAILESVDRALPPRLASPVMAELVDAYSRPALVVPPAVDDGALAALTTLREQGYTLAVVSNAMRTPGRTLRKLLERYRLLSCFAHTTFSDEVGIRKPSPEIFALTLRAVGGDPATAVHVGDDAILDVHGARAAAMRVIQVVARAGAGSAEPSRLGLDAYRPNAVIPCLSALPEAIARLEQEEP